MQTAINLWSLRNVEATLPELIARVGEAGYDGVQISGGLRDAAPEDARRACEDAGLAPLPAHVGSEDLGDGFDATVETYRTVGCPGLVLPYLPPERFASESAAVETAADLADLADRLAGAGLKFHYHNHDAEFQDVGDGPAFDVLLDRTDVAIELDVGWVRAAGYDPVAYLERLDGRVDVVHMRDVDADGEDCVLGEGVVDMPACADAARAAGAEWFVHERVDPEYPASVDHGAAFLADL
jgi:sugar phosphate isomerase/epimerase